MPYVGYTESMSTRGLTESEIVESPVTESDRLASLARALASVPVGSEPVLLGPDEAPIPLTKSIFDVLKIAVDALMAGHAVAISPLERMLTTTEAADLLGVSRQYLTRLLDSGVIPHSFTGRHRRIQLADLLTYQRERNASRAALLDAMTREAAAAGEYD
jgi:excisionase family DNA binding protein